MDHIIQLLPDSIANQIAAGEVVQRPASVIKELLENAIDAGADHIEVVVKNAGKTLMQVTDNGAGMSAQDARMSFERHATSKIRQADDLFGIRTLGFRGEALASIAAIAQVSLRTRLHDEEVGTEIEIAGSTFKSQQACATPPGSTFYVKNLFFNVPARRNFLKSNSVEMRHIINEFIRVAIPNPQVHLSLIHNDTEVFDLPASKVQERLIQVFGDELKGKLIPVEESTGYVKIGGFIASPEVHRKSRGEQFFFINGRFIKSAYLHHAIATAFQDFIPEKKHPFYCMFLEIDPVHVDINIHPTKTEVKFDDERTIYVLVHSIVKRGLGESTQVPTFDFGKTDIQEAIYKSTNQRPQDMTVGNFKPPASRDSKLRSSAWDQLYRPENPAARSSERPSGERALFDAPRRKVASEVEGGFWVQLQQGYILTQREGLLIIHQQLAHQRILFEKFLHAGQGRGIASQQLLFPQTVELSAVEYQAFKEVEPALGKMGFEVKEFGLNTFIVYGTPPEIPTSKVRDIFEQMIADIQEMGKVQFKERLHESMARAVALRSAIGARQTLSLSEMKQLVEDLFRCTAPGYSPTGKPTYKQISAMELEKYFG